MNKSNCCVHTQHVLGADIFSAKVESASSVHIARRAHYIIFNRHNFFLTDTAYLRRHRAFKETQFFKESPRFNVLKLNMVNTTYLACAGQIRGVVGFNKSPRF